MNAPAPYPQEEKKPPAQEPQGAELIDSVLDVVRKEAEGGRPQSAHAEFPIRIIQWICPDRRKGRTLGRYRDR